MELFAVIFGCLTGFVTGAAVVRLSLREARKNTYPAARRVLRIRQREPPAMAMANNLPDMSDSEFIKELHALMAYDGQEQEETE